MKRFLMSKKEQQLNDSIENIESMIETMDKQNQGAQENINDIEKELAQLFEEKNLIKQPVVPGKKIKEYIQHWNDLLERQQYTPDKLRIFAKELAKSLEQYEKELKEMDTGQTILFKRLRASYDIKIADIKNKTQLRIEALERALNYSKMKCTRHRERAEMYIAEMQSRLLNNVKTKKNLNEFLTKCQEGKGFDNIFQAREVIRQLTEMMIQAKETMEQTDEQIKELKGKLKKNTNIGQKIKENLHKENNMRQFYQKLVMKFCRDIQIFQEDEVKLQKFNQINEYDDNLFHQLSYKTTLKHLNPEREIVNFVNSQQQYQEIIQMFHEYYEDFHDSQMQTIEQLMDEYIQKHFIGKKKEKKIKIDMVYKFQDFLTDRLNEQIEGILDFVEETMDHQPQIQRANSRSGLHPSKYDQNQYEKQQSSVFKSKLTFRRQNSQCGVSSYERARSIRSRNLDKSDVQSQGNDDEEMVSYQFSSFDQSNKDINEDAQMLDQLKLSFKAPSSNERYESSINSHSKRSGVFQKLSPKDTMRRTSRSPGGIANDASQGFGMQQSGSQKQIQPMNFIAFKSKKLIGNIRSRKKESSILSQFSSPNIRSNQDNMSIHSKLQSQYQQSEMKSQRLYRRQNTTHQSRVSIVSSRRNIEPHESSSASSSSDSSSISQITDQIIPEGHCKFCKQKLPLPEKSEAENASKDQNENQDKKSKVDSYSKEKSGQLDSQETQSNNKKPPIKSQSNLTSILKQSSNLQLLNEIQSDGNLSQIKKSIQTNQLQDDDLNEDKIDVTIESSSVSKENSKEQDQENDKLNQNQDNANNQDTSEKSKKDLPIDKSNQEIQINISSNVKAFQQKFAQAFREKYMKYEHLIEHQITQTYKTGKKFQLTQDQMSQLKTLMLETLDSKIEEQDLQNLEQNDIREFFNSYNQLIQKQIPEKQDEESESKNQYKMQMSEILVPQIGQDGNLKQLHIDKDLARVSFLKNDFDFKMITKLIRHCNYINSLLKDGLVMENTFDMKVIIDDYVYHADMEVQVDPEEFKEKVEQPEVVESVNTVIDTLPDLNTIIKDHLINLQSRQNTELKKQFQSDWAEMQLNDTLQIQLPEIFIDKQQKSNQESGLNINALEYIKGVIQCLEFKIHCMRDTREIIIEELVVNPAENIQQLNRSKNDVPLREQLETINLYKDRQIQVDPIVSHKKVQTEIQSQSRINRVAQNLIILDKKLQDQMIDLLLTFDAYVNYNEKIGSDNNNQQVKKAIQEFGTMFQQNIQKFQDEKSINESVNNAIKDEKMQPLPRKIIVTQKLLKFKNSLSLTDQTVQYQDLISSGTLTPISETKLNSQSYPAHTNQNQFNDFREKQSREFIEQQNKSIIFNDHHVLKPTSKLFPKIQNPQNEIKTTILNSKKEETNQRQNNPIPLIQQRGHLNQSFDLGMNYQNKHVKHMSIDSTKLQAMKKSQKTLNKITVDIQNRLDTELGIYLKKPDQIGKRRIQNLNNDLFEPSSFQNLNSPLNHKIGAISQLNNSSALTTTSNLPVGILRKIHKQQELDKQKSYMTLHGMKRNPSLTKDTSNTRLQNHQESHVNLDSRNKSNNYKTINHTSNQIKLRNTNIEFNVKDLGQPSKKQIRNKKMIEQSKNSQSMNQQQFLGNQAANASTMMLSQNQIQFQVKKDRPECLTPTNQDKVFQVLVSNLPQKDSEVKMSTDPSAQFLLMSPTSIQRNFHNTTQSFFKSPTISNKSYATDTKKQFLTIKQISPKNNVSNLQSFRQNSKKNIQINADLKQDKERSFERGKLFQVQYQQDNKRKQNLILDLNQETFQTAFPKKRRQFTDMQYLKQMSNNANQTIYSDNSITYPDDKNTLN